MFKVMISMKSFQKFLNSHVVSSTTIACECLILMPSADCAHWAAGICENHCIILYVYVGDIADAGGVLTYYIPAIVDASGA